MRAFSPSNKTALIDVASTTANVQMTTENGMQQVRVMNNGTATAWIAFGDSTVTAALASAMPVGPSVTEVFTVAEGQVYAAAIAAASTGKIYFTPGNGF